MPALFEYFLKLSISVSVIYLFYQLVLRRLTFYNLNRWYLAGYTVLCFVMPFVDVSKLTTNTGRRSIVQYVPTVNSITTANITRASISTTQTINWWQVVIYILVAGSAIMFLRMMVQVIALRKIKRTSVVISEGNTNIYHTNSNITPFSFGSSIYLNKNLHTEAELEEIILHEYVHVRQLHTLDIILAELLCIINWYNPFAWLIRHSIKQNLEYIADDNVVNTGIDKKAYQYHLLKVIGIPQYRIANQFNFASLKNRIMMMNKARSAKINLLKFLFILLLLAVILVAFRNQVLLQQVAPETYAVIFYDLDNGKRLADVEVKEINGDKIYKSDNNGYLVVKPSPSRNKKLSVNLRVKKAGYFSIDRIFTYQFRDQENTIIEVLALRKQSIINKCKGCDTFEAYLKVLQTNSSSLRNEADGYYAALINQNKKNSSLKLSAKKPKHDKNSVKMAKASISIIEKGKTVTSISAEDSLLIDTSKKMMTFYGKVKVQDGDKTINASKMTIPQRTWLGWTSALVLIDGVERSVDELQNIDEKSVKSFTLLRDASATAIYGSRGANGVILVQTKKPAEKIGNN
ncbi:TonB-dependent receptor plug domain-containing protein [Mucilaginibacter roseus]|uniref:TonB-dependent receptor plug domain-containing protein n=1 Tax=Mucilaginibacter roseus TaxID=1528868 RepID=A0ABS8U346_9SPHI|nr:M56 family metallopeptidase [Mucilaginibacter roseus]MCD8740490.1 TonB-dependent receptor plug domain-containing protein [Mucilaginibacter roseus]